MRFTIKKSDSVLPCSIWCNREGKHVYRIAAPTSMTFQCHLLSCDSARNTLCVFLYFFYLSKQRKFTDAFSCLPASIECRSGWFFLCLLCLQFSSVKSWMISTEFQYKRERIEHVNCGFTWYRLCGVCVRVDLTCARTRMTARTRTRAHTLTLIYVLFFSWILVPRTNSVA